MDQNNLPNPLPFTSIMRWLVSKVGPLYRQIRVNWLGILILGMTAYAGRLLVTGPGSRSLAVTQPQSMSASQVVIVGAIEGEKTLFTVQSAPEVIEIMALDIDASSTIDVSQSKSRNLQPAVGPDGESVAFISDRDQPGVFHLYVVAKPGELAHRLTTPERVNDHLIMPDTIIAWSPSGAFLAFTGEKSGSRQLFTVDLSGSRVLQVTMDPYAVVSSVHWLNDDALVFASNRENGMPGLWVVQRDGSLLTKVSVK